MYAGTISKIDYDGDKDGGYGYIKPDAGGKEIRFKEAGVKGNAFSTLARGDRVKYEIHSNGQAHRVEKA